MFLTYVKWRREPWRTSEEPGNLVRSLHANRRSTNPEHPHYMKIWYLVGDDWLHMTDIELGSIPPYEELWDWVDDQVQEMRKR